MRKFKNLILLTALLCATAVWAQDEYPAYVTDVILIGTSDSKDESSYVQQYTAQGYEFTYDMNAGATGPHIWLGVKKGRHESTNGGYITDFVVVKYDDKFAYRTFQYGGRIYHLCPYDGDNENFKNIYGNLNSGNPGDNLYLYYTKDEMPNKVKTAVYDIIIDDSYKHDRADLLYWGEGMASPEWSAETANIKAGSWSGPDYVLQPSIGKQNRPLTDPVIKTELVYNGQRQLLIDTPATTESIVTMYYRGGDCNHDYDIYKNNLGYTATPTQVMAKNVGNYTVKYFAGANNYGHDSEPRERQVTIVKSPNDRAYVTCENIFEGDVPSPVLHDNLSTSPYVSFWYSTSKTGEYSSEKPSEAGPHWVKAYIPGDDNCEICETEPVKFDIMNDARTQTNVWTDGTYSLKEDWTCSERIRIDGNVKLILAEGTTFTATKGIGVGNTGMYDENTLTIEGSGTLIATGNDYNAGIGGTTNSLDWHSMHGTIHINGGNITAIGGKNAAGIGGGHNSRPDARSRVNINGGVVYAQGGVNAAGIGGGQKKSNDHQGYTYGTPGRITINGGQVTARAGENACGIGKGSNATSEAIASDGSLTISWKNYADFIDVDSYDINSFSIAEGKKFTDDVSFYNQKTSSSTLKALVNTRLHPVFPLVLENSAENSDVIDNNNGKGLSVIINGRKLWMDGSWNTLCLPFSLTTFTGTPLEGATVKTLRSTSYADGTLTMNFSKDQNSIEAGKPYIVKWDESTISSMPIFNPSDELVASLGLITETPAVDNGFKSNWWQNDENYDRLVDGNTNTKYCLNNGEPWVEFHYSNPITPKAYALWTAGDTEGHRNPATWTIKAKNSGDSDWTTLVTVDNNNWDKLPHANNAQTIFVLPNNTAYTHFRFSAIRDVNVSNIFQLAELQFFTNQPEAVEHPTFLGVIKNTTNNVETEYVDFIGNFDPVDFEAQDKTILYLGGDNKLYYPKKNMNIKSFRGYFKLKGVTADELGNDAKSIVLNFDDNETSEISDATLLNDKGQVRNDSWYTLDGRKLNGKPTQKGIYIHKGKKIVK